jgi:hypothetical protein
MQWEVWKGGQHLKIRTEPEKFYFHIEESTPLPGAGICIEGG